MLWYVLSDVQHQLDPLVRRSFREQLHRLFQHVLGAEVDRLEANATRLDLGEIEDVVDDVQQSVAGAANRLHVFALLRRQLRFHQQPGHADHPVHRRADLVAHRGKELRLESRQLLQLLVPLRKIGQELRLGRLRLGGGGAVVLELDDDPPDQDAERDEQESFE